jgi:catechol-2,3-dioxygenase
MSTIATTPVSGVMVTHGFAELTIEVRDLDALERFYTDLFELKVLAREDDRVWLAAGERARLGLWLPGEKEFGDEGGRHVHYAFSAGPGGLDRLAARLDDAGHPYRGPVEHDGGDRSLYVEDLEGNVVEVWDFFERGEGRRDGASALAGDDVREGDPSS